MPDESFSELQASASAALSRIALLTYQQKQLVASGELLPVLDQLIRRRRLVTVIITLACAWLLFQSARSVFVQKPSLFSICLFAIAAYWLYRRLRMQRHVVSAVRRYQSALPDDNSPSSSLAVDLKLNHQLTYEQHQSLKQGNAVKVATELAAARRKNANSMMLGAVAASLGIFVVDWVLLVNSNRIDALMVQNYFANFAACDVILVCACVCSFRERIVARRLDRLIAIETAKPSHAAEWR